MLDKEKVKSSEEVVENIEKEKERRKSSKKLMRKKHQKMKQIKLMSL